MTPPGLPLHGRVAVVTSASWDSGKAIALDLACVGAHATVGGRSLTERADR